jgi:hypothetical protein
MHSSQHVACLMRCFVGLEKSLLFITFVSLDNEVRFNHRTKNKQRQRWGQGLKFNATFCLNFLFT